MVKIRFGAESVGDVGDHPNRPCTWVDANNPKAGLGSGNLNPEAYNRGKNFYDIMSSQGHTKVFHWWDESAWESDFRHPDSGGNSLLWSDNVHFCYFSDHGTNYNIDPNPQYKFEIIFSVEKQRCRTGPDQWKLGSKMLKWLVLDCCECLTKVDADEIANTWFPPAHGIHMIFGFVGSDPFSSWMTQALSNFDLKAAVGDNLGNAWLDTFDSGAIPVVMAYGSTEQEAVARRDWETINSLYWDVGSANWIAYKWRS